MTREAPQLRIHLPVEFGVGVLPPAWRRHVTYGLGTGLELRWSKPKELASRIEQARWGAMLDPTYDHDCSTLAWDLWAVGSLFLLSSNPARTMNWATDRLMGAVTIPHGYCKHIGLVIGGLQSARAKRFADAPSPEECAAIGASALGLLVVNHVNLSGTPAHSSVVEQVSWLRSLTTAVARPNLMDELEAHWASGMLPERAPIRRSLERLSSRA